MSKLDEIGIIGDDGGVYWGSKRRYPTKEAFIEAVKDFEGDMDDSDIRKVTESHMRRCKVTDSSYDIMWGYCKAPPVVQRQCGSWHETDTHQAQVKA